MERFLDAWLNRPVGCRLFRERSPSVAVASGSLGHRVIHRVLETREGNLAGGATLLIASIAGFGLLRALSPHLPTNVTGGPLWLPLVMGLVSVPAFGGLVLVLAGTGLGIRDGLRAGVLGYATLGALVVVLGIPGYVPSGFMPAGPFWPFFLLWLHGCLFPIGLWPCPPG